MRVVFHVELDLDYRDQVAPIIDDLRDRYGLAEDVWAEIVDQSYVLDDQGVWHAVEDRQVLASPRPEDALSFDEAEAAGVDGTNRFRSL